MSINDQYALNWSNHTNHLRKAFDSLLSSNEFVDVTLSCEGRKVGAHKMLLSACSVYFHELFRENPCQHPIVILKDVKFQNLVDILKFIYNGEVSVATENFDSFLKTAELLQISGLTENESRYDIGEKDNNDNPSDTAIGGNKQFKLLKPDRSKSFLEMPKEKETSKKRTTERSDGEEGTAQKKRRDDETKTVTVEIKQESDLVALDEDEEEEYDIKDPLELDQQNDSLEASDLLQPAGSQKYADVQDLLNGAPESSSELSTNDSTSSGSTCRINTALITKLMGNVETIKRDLKYMTNLILLLSNPNAPSAQEQVGVNSVNVKSTIAELKEFNDALEDADLLSATSTTLQLVGGKDVVDTTRRLLGKIVKNSVALECNWSGRNNKENFSNFKNVVKLILVTVRKNPLATAATQHEVESVIKAWLRSACDRDGGRSNRAHKD